MQGFNFNERLGKVVALARDEAKRLNHDRVDTEHLLLGIIAEGEGVAAAVLTNLGISLNTLKAAVEDLSKPNPAIPVTDPDLPYTSPAKKVLELAMGVARDLHHDHVGTQHVLIGLIREENGIAAKALQQAGITESSVYYEVCKLLGMPLPTQWPSRVVHVMVQVRLANGALRRGDFTSLAAAIEFLSAP